MVENSPNNKIDPNKKFYFQEIKDADTIHKTFCDVAHEKGDLQVWQKGSDKVECYKVKSYADDTKTVLMTTEGGLLASLSGSSFLNQEVLYKTWLGKYQYFGTGNLTRDLKTGDYSMSWFGPQFQSQQRTNYRIEASIENVIKFESEGINFQVVDLSAGGISIAVRVTSENKDQYNKGFFFNNCKIIYNSSTFIIPKAEVMVAKPFTFSDASVGVQLGMAFRDTPKDVEQKLVTQINTYARYQEIRKTIAKK